MGMLDDLEKMMMLQQMQSQQQGQGYDPFSQGGQPMGQHPQNMMMGSPLEKGSMMAVQSARDSIAAKNACLPWMIMKIKELLEELYWQCRIQ